MAGKTGQGIVVIGGQWGDEGKGRIVDTLADNCDVVARFQGGNNAGHSLHLPGLSIVLHLIPCGIVRSDKVCVIGNGVVIDPEVLFQEIDLLAQHGVRVSATNLKIARNAHIIFPFHKLVDAERENQSESHIGTTKRGIGPCYEDKIARFGITANDLTSDVILHKKLSNIMRIRQMTDGAKRQAMPLSYDEMFFAARSYGEKLRPFLCDVGELLEDYLKSGRRVLFEGAQGTLLDVDHGTYPFVTSSNCVAAQASIGTGIGMKWMNEVLLVSKAYCTRVGDGPFFTEASAEEQDHFRTIGNEFGATTGRPRRCGWLDLPALKYAVRLNGATGLVLTKVDVLGMLGKIKIGMSYTSGARKGLSFQDAMELYLAGEMIDVEYQELPKVTSVPNVVEKISDLPNSLRVLCDLVEKSLQIPVRMISFGKKRGQELFITP